MNGLTEALTSGSGGRLKDTMDVWKLISPDRNSLNKLKRMSVRNKSWFKVLSWEQRRFIDAAIMVAERRIRSLLVLRLLAPSVMKLLRAVERGDVVKALAFMSDIALRMMKDFAQKISWIAQSWGNKLAHKWVEDAGFIKYLTVMSLP